MVQIDVRYAMMIANDQIDQIDGEECTKRMYSV